MPRPPSISTPAAPGSARPAREPTLETPGALHELHPAAIPFAAIDVLLGPGVDLAPAAIDAKLIDAGRGGYCFEQNSLLMRALPPWVSPLKAWRRGCAG